MLIVKWFVIVVALLIIVAVAAGSWVSCKARRPPTWACATAS